MITNKIFHPTSDEYDLNMAFFKWLFEKNNIELHYEEDPVPLVRKPLIYYPKELKDLFETFPMQRLKKILQLSKFIDNNSNALHTRYEHSLGVYNLKRQIILQQFVDNPEFKKYVEQNDLKLNLIAELIKSAGHDIGHLPLSHSLESSVIQKPGFHEEIGKRILLENEQIQSCLSNISPKLPQILQDTLEHNYFGFKLLDEGNYDIDRFDYLYRDLAFNEKPEYKEFEPFKLLKSKDAKSSFIPVFDISSIDSIEEFLNLRVMAYKDFYYHPMTEIRDKSTALVIKKALETNEPNGTNLQQFLVKLKNIHSANDVNLDEWLSWNDLRFYNELLNIAEFSENKALQKAAIFSVPGLDQLLDISAKMLNLKNTSNQLTPNENAFLKRLHKYITEKNDFTRALSDFNYWDKCIKYTTNPQKVRKLQTNSNLPVEFYSHNIVGYNTKEPIFFQTEDGKIYTYDAIPNRTPKVSSDKITLDIAFCFLPFLGEPTQSNVEISSTLNEKRQTSFGIPYFNRPSPAGTYIENTMKKNDEER